MNSHIFLLQLIYSSVNTFSLLNLFKQISILSLSNFLGDFLVKK